MVIFWHVFFDGVFYPGFFSFVFLLIRFFTLIKGFLAFLTVKKVFFMAKGTGLNNRSHVRVYCKCNSCVIGGLNDISFFRSGSPPIMCKIFVYKLFKQPLRRLVLYSITIIAIVVIRVQVGPEHI